MHRILELRDYRAVYFLKPRKKQNLKVEAIGKPNYFKYSKAVLS